MSRHRAVRNLDLDEELAEDIRRRDRAIDELESQINTEAARLIALRAPAATDLRTALSVIKIAEIGDISRFRVYQIQDEVDHPEEKRRTLAAARRRREQARTAAADTESSARVTAPRKARRRDA